MLSPRQNGTTLIVAFGSEIRIATAKQPEFINRGVMAVASTIEEVLTRFELDNKRPPSVAEFKEAFDLNSPDVRSPKKRSRKKSR